MSLLSGELEAVREAGQLQAVTFEIGRHAIPDVFRAAGAKGRLLWAKPPQAFLGLGEALTIPLPAGWGDPGHVGIVTEALAAINVPASAAGETRPGPVAMGALPYDPGAEGHLTVPRFLLRTNPAGLSATVVVPRDQTEPISALKGAIDNQLEALDEAALSQQQSPDSFDLSSSMPHAQWLSLVKRAVAATLAGELDKVVLARTVRVTANRPFVLGEVLARLASLYPSCAIFHVEGFVGASPETLVRRAGYDIWSHPLAGTVARSGDEQSDKALVAGLMASPKDRQEHRVVVDEIASRLRPLCQRLEVPETPSVIGLRNVSHLATVISGALQRADGKTLPTALELAALLQPTPAVGGHPLEAALEWQRCNEGFDRGRYAGPVGWVDASGDGEWALGVRSATVSGRHADLYAGNGIVAGSDPATELAETQLKLQALLAALVRP